MINYLLNHEDILSNLPLPRGNFRLPKGNFRLPRSEFFVLPKKSENTLKLPSKPNILTKDLTEEQKEYYFQTIERR